MALPIVVPIGAFAQPTADLEEIISQPVEPVEIRLSSLNSEIVSVVPLVTELPVVKQPEPVAVVRAIRNAICQPTPTEISANYLPEPDLAGKEALVHQIAEAYGLDGRILSAVWQIESGRSWFRNVCSVAGAQGPCQFMPGTWRAYARDGNGDGYKDVNYAPDCLHGAAHYLRANLDRNGTMEAALLRYNHSCAYVRKVISMAGYTNYYLPRCG